MVTTHAKIKDSEKTIQNNAHFSIISLMNAALVVEISAHIPLSRCLNYYSNKILMQGSEMMFVRVGSEDNFLSL